MVLDSQTLIAATEVCIDHFGQLHLASMWLSFHSFVYVLS